MHLQELIDQPIMVTIIIILLHISQQILLLLQEQNNPLIINCKPYLTKYDIFTA